jgi:tRNA(Arg) A34 adenosine deaminase TadA
VPRGGWHDHGVTTKGNDRLLALATPWQLALAEGWAAFRSANPPVGAVITGTAGLVLAAARSRRHDAAAPPGQLAGTDLAHAEVNALAQLPAGHYEDLTLWTTLQPCPLCSAAAMSTRCGQVRYLAADPVWDGAERLPELNESVAARWPRFEGPEPGWPAFWQTALSVAYQVRRGNADGITVTARAKQAPDAADLGRTIAADPSLRHHLMTLDLPAALDELLFS